MGLPEILAGTMLASLFLYALLGGADFGGGLWDLFAFGERAKAQRALIDRAMGPVWEANHVWLILIVVILFTAFPPAFASATTWLHVPLTVMLLGIVVRGSAFIFRSHDERGARFERRWDRLFALSSVVPPFFLGVCLGAVSSGALDAGSLSQGDFTARFILPWARPFPVLVGLFAVALFGFLAATYLTIEARGPKLQDDFRKQAFRSGAATATLAIATAIAAAWVDVGHVHEGRLGAWWAWVIAPAAAVAWLLALRSLFRRSFRTARVMVAALVVLVLSGWALGQYPYLIAPDVTIRGAAAPEATLRPLTIVLVLGTLVLFPSLYWLLRVFKGREVFGSGEE